MPIQPAPSVRRALQVVEFLAEHPGEEFSLSQIAREVILSKATCQAVLLALCERGHVVRSESSLGFSLGPAFIRIGEAALASVQLIEVAQPVVQAISDRFGLPCTAGIALGREMIVVASAAPPMPFVAKLRRGQSVPFAPPLGAVLVAWENEQRIATWLDNSARHLDARDRSEYEAALAGVRARGYCVAVEERRNDAALNAITEQASHPGPAEALERLIRTVTDTYHLPVEVNDDERYRVAQIATPVFDRRGAVAMTLAVTGMRDELTGEQIRAYASVLQSESLGLTLRIAGRWRTEPIEDPATGAAVL